MSLGCSAATQGAAKWLLNTCSVSIKQCNNLWVPSCPGGVTASKGFPAQQSAAAKSCAPNVTHGCINAGPLTHPQVLDEQGLGRQWSRRVRRQLQAEVRELLLHHRALPAGAARHLQAGVKIFQQPAVSHYAAVVGTSGRFIALIVAWHTGSAVGVLCGMQAILYNTPQRTAPFPLEVRPCHMVWYHGMHRGMAEHCTCLVLHAEAEVAGGGVGGRRQLHTLAARCRRLPPQHL